VLEIGSSLREARRRRGVALSEAEAATKIRTRYLEALETERFELLPEGPYLRSFLREYAEYLGLDGDIFVNEYMFRFPPPPAPEPESTPSRNLVAVLGDLPRGVLLTVGAIVAIAAIGAWQLDQKGSSVATPSTPHIHAPPPRQPVTPVQSHVTKTAAHTTPAPGSLVLTAAHGTCWLQVRVGSSTGRVVAEETLQPGGRARFGLRQPLWIRLGAPWNVEASIGHRSVTASLPTRTGNVLVSARSVAAA
jgi:cytoskeleton protein RodZ